MQQRGMQQLQQLQQVVRQRSLGSRRQVSVRIYLDYRHTYIHTISISADINPYLAGVQVLALIDDATQEQRLTLWAIDVLKYGEPFSTPLRQFYLPSTSQADATKQALGVVVAIGSHPAPAVPHTAESSVAALLQLLLLYKGARLTACLHSFIGC